MDKKKTSVALGTFDGIHTGHQAVLNAALSKKRMNKVNEAVTVFSLLVLLYIMISSPSYA